MPVSFAIPSLVKVIPFGKTSPSLGPVMDGSNEWTLECNIRTWGRILEKYNQNQLIWVFNLPYIPTLQWFLQTSNLPQYQMSKLSMIRTKWLDTIDRDKYSLLRQNEANQHIIQGFHCNYQSQYFQMLVSVHRSIFELYNGKALSVRVPVRNKTNFRNKFCSNTSNN